MHASAYSWVEKCASAIPVANRVVELGSRNVNGSCRPLFPESQYIGIDSHNGPGVDHVCAAESWIGDGEYDVVICAEVLEHTDKGAAICANANRLLRPGGTFIVTCASIGRPAHSAIDGGPVGKDEFYRNVPRGTLESWLAAFANTTIDDSVPGDIYALAIK